MKKFEIIPQSETVDGLTIHVVRVEGYLDSSTFPELEEHLDHLVEENNYYIVVDFEKLNYISSAGLGVLMGLLQQVRDGGGDLKLAKMSAKIRNLFDMLGFSRLLRIYDDVPLAKKAFLEEKEKSESGKSKVSQEDSY